MPIASAAPGRFDGGNVDLPHRRHGLEGALCLAATRRKRIGRDARSDLPRQAPTVLAPPTRAFRATIADDRLPVPLRLFLIVRRDLEGEGFTVLDRRPPLSPRQGMPRKKRFPGNPTKSYRSRQPLRVIAEHTNWQGGVEPI
jgi:hypothetical protein